MRDQPPVNTAISGSITIRCPKCKTVVAWEKFNDATGERRRSWQQEQRLRFLWRWPFIRREPVPLKLHCPKGCV